MFIDDTYFTGELYVPQADQSTDLVQAIEQYEKEVLIQLLGYKLYALLVADCTLGVPATQKYIDLVNGAEFTHTYNGITTTLKWEGLVNSGKISILAYYTYFKFVERDITRLYGTGMSMAPAGQDYQRVSPVNKLCYAWERMRELYGIIPAEYKRYYLNPISNPSHAFDLNPSAYNFLYVNKANYPDWIFAPQWNINMFGI
jgi:hypothetical protein